MQLTNKTKTESEVHILHAATLGFQYNILNLHKQTPSIAAHLLPSGLFCYPSYTVLNYVLFPL